MAISRRECWSAGSTRSASGRKSASFKVNLHEEVPKRRAELAVAALTIVRAYIAAGSPRPEVPTFGRFEQWQEWCRFPLIWLGMADPCETRATLEERDPVRERLAELSGAWAAVYDTDEVTLATPSRTRSRTRPCSPTEASDARARLRPRSMEAAGEGGAPNARKLGWFLAKHEGRIEDGRRFRRGEERRAGALWHVETVAKGAGIAASAGFRQPDVSNWQTSPNTDTYIEWAENHPQKPHNPQSGRRSGVRPVSAAAAAARGQSGRRRDPPGRRQAQGLGQSLARTAGPPARAQARHRRDPAGRCVPLVRRRVGVAGAGRRHVRRWHRRMHALRRCRGRPHLARR